MTVATSRASDYLLGRRFHKFHHLDRIEPGLAASGYGPAFTPLRAGRHAHRADQVAIDTVAAAMMGFNPLDDCKFIRLAHERGLGCGDIKDIEIAGDEAVAAERWDFVGPFRKMTFASRMQHRIYWGPLKKPIEWSLKTVLAPWAYMASVVYHDSFWYPVKAKRLMARVLDSPWGRLVRHWETVRSDERGYPEIPESGATIKRTGVQALAKSLGILATCLKEAPEFASRRRRQRVRR